MELVRARILYILQMKNQKPNANTNIHDGFSFYNLGLQIFSSLGYS